jgi:membrane fusion protein (multidrug efflux system)
MDENRSPYPARSDGTTGEVSPEAIRPMSPSANAPTLANEATAPPPPSSPPHARGRWRRRAVLWGSIIVAVGVACYFAIPWVKDALNTVSTDDAYVNSHVTFVAPRVQGQVVRVLVDDNYRVKKGDLLVQLDKQPYQVSVDRKQAALDVAEAKLIQARATSQATAAMGRALRYQMLNAMQQVRGQVQQLQGDVASLRKYRAALENADKEYRRVLRLKGGESVSPEEIDARRAAFLSAEAEVRGAQENIRKTRASLSLPIAPPEGKELGHTPPDLEQSHPSVRAALAQMVQTGAQLGLNLPLDADTPQKVLETFHLLHADSKYEEFVHNLIDNAPAIKVAVSDVEQADADLAQARLDLSYTDIVAEIDGVVTRRNVNAGNNVSVGQSLMAVRSLTEIWIDANFKETQLADLRIGQRVRCEVDMYGSRREYEGRITGFTMGTGQTLALLPPQNATGNFVKIVQRLPVRIELTDYDPDKAPLFVGLSVEPHVYYKEPPTGPHAGEMLQPLYPLPQGRTASGP